VKQEWVTTRHIWQSRREQEKRSDLGKRGSSSEQAHSPSLHQSSLATAAFTGPWSLVHSRHLSGPSSKAAAGPSEGSERVEERERNARRPYNGGCELWVVG